MSADAVDAAVRRVASRRPDLGTTPGEVADALTAGEGATMIHQAALQQWLWWFMPRDYPGSTWTTLVDAAAELLDELGLAHLAAVARSERTATVHHAWRLGIPEGARAFRDAQASSGVQPPDTPVLTWGSVMGSDESAALDAVERALGEAVRCGTLVPGAPRWRSRAEAITVDVLSRPLDLPPGQTLAGLVTTERVAHWVDAAHHPTLQAWRAAVANRLLNPIPPPADPGEAASPARWLLELASAPGGAELTQSFYLARAAVLDAVERFGWWPWSKAPRSEADVHQLATLRDAASRLRLVRRRGRRLHVTSLGSRLLASPADLWHAIASETEDDADFSRMVTELVGLRLLHGRTEIGELASVTAPILAAQGWSGPAGPLTTGQVSTAIWTPLRWWRLFGATDEVEATWEHGTGRRLTPHTVALHPDGEAMVLAFLHRRAAGPRSSLFA